MDPVNRRRLWGYPLAALATGSLIYGGFLYEADPDPWTLLGSVDVQLRLAAGMPEQDSEGQPLSARQKLIDDCRAMLVDVDRMLPGCPEAQEYWAFLLKLDGDYAGAVARYRAGRAAPDCEPDLRDTMLFNEARTLHQWGRSEEAIEVLSAGRADLQPKFHEDADLLVAAIHVGLGQTDRAQALALEIAERDGVSPTARIRSAHLLEDLGCVELADAAYQRAGDASASGLYYRARLKMTAGAVDTALDLLERATATAPEQVAQFLQRDSETWGAAAADARFQQIQQGSAHDTATPGR